MEIMMEMIWRIMVMEAGTTRDVDTVEVAIPVAEAEVSVDVAEVPMVASLIFSRKPMTMTMRVLFLFGAEVVVMVGAKPEEEVEILNRTDRSMLVLLVLNQIDIICMISAFVCGWKPALMSSSFVS